VEYLVFRNELAAYCRQSQRTREEKRETAATEATISRRLLAMQAGFAPETKSHKTGSDTVARGEEPIRAEKTVL
jgi:hypothetical protein